MLVTTNLVKLSYLHPMIMNQKLIHVGSYPTQRRATLLRLGFSEKYAIMQWLLIRGRSLNNAPHSPL